LSSAFAGRTACLLEKGDRENRSEGVIESFLLLAIYTW
jgi:hypothetical protein